MTRTFAPTILVVLCALLRANAEMPNVTADATLEHEYPSVCPDVVGWYGDMELGWLKTHQAGRRQIGGPTTGTSHPTFDFAPSFRMSLGYDAGEGRGARVRYWHFDAKSGVDARASSGELRRELRSGAAWRDSSFAGRDSETTSSLVTPAVWVC